MIDIRLLTEKDALSFRTLRLQGLQEAPEAFISSAEEFEQQTLAQIAERLRIAGDPPERFVLGAFEREDVLIGMAGFFRETEGKMRHKARIWGMYVAPKGRRQGIGRQLVHELLRRGRMLAGLEQVQLAVISTNEGAHQLYAHAGFQKYGLEPRALKYREQYWDEELMVLFLEQ